MLGDILSLGDRLLVIVGSIMVRIWNLYFFKVINVLKYRQLCYTIHCRHLECKGAIKVKHLLNYDQSRRRAFGLPVQAFFDVFEPKILSAEMQK